MFDLATNPILKSFLAGSLSGTCSTIIFQPLDLIKTRIQNSPGPNMVTLQPGASGTVNVVKNPSMMRILIHVLQSENIGGLWKGITPSITRTVPGVGLYFSSLHWLKANLLDGEPTPLQAVVLGMTARSFAGSLVIPVTVVKTRFESGIYDYGGMAEAFRKIYGGEGARGLCRGLVPTLARDAPFSGIYLMFYTQIKGSLPAEVRQNANAVFACGIFSGILASLVTQPADVVKTKMQLYPVTHTDVRTSVWLIYQKYGIAGFLKGLAPRALRRSLMASLAWTVYEQIMKTYGLK